MVQQLEVKNMSQFEKSRDIPTEKRIIIQVPVNEEEKKALKKLAIDRGEPMSEMLRQTVLSTLL